MNSKKYSSANKERYLNKSCNFPLGFANKQANGEGDLLYTNGSNFGMNNITIIRFFLITTGRVLLFEGIFRPADNTHLDVLYVLLPIVPYYNILNHSY